MKQARKCSGQIAAPAIVVAAAVAWAWLFHTGLFCSDDTRYLAGAVRLALGLDISVNSPAERRAFFLLPAALAYRMASNIDAAIAVYNAFYVALGCVAYACARLWWRPWPSAAVAIVALSQPALLLYSGAMLPDVSTACFAALSLYLLCRWVGGDAGLSEGARVLAPFWAGVSLVCAFASKESGAILLPIGIVFALGRVVRDPRSGGKEALAFVGGLLVAHLAEAAIFRWSAGHWYSSLLSLFKPHDLATFADIQGHTPIRRLGTLGSQLGLSTSLLFLLAGVSTIQIVRERIRGELHSADAARWLAIVAFWLWPTLYFTFGTASPNAYVLPMIQQRYFALCIVPACLLAARLASSLAAFGRGRKWLRMAVVSSLVLAVAATLHLARRQRGFIYHVAEKESYLTAVYVIRTRYSQALPVLDFGSGWTSDLGACRALLRARDSRGNRQGFEESLQSRSKLRNHVAEFTSVSGRYAAVGHGDWLGSVEGRALVSSAEKRKQRIEKIGRYFPLR